MQNPVSKGLKAIESLSLQEMDDAILWLTEMLHTYKTLRAVKTVLDKRVPQLIEDEFESAVDMDRRLQKEVEPLSVHLDRRSYKQKMLDLLKTYPEGLAADDIASQLELTDKQVYCVCKNYPKLFVRYGRRVMLRTQDSSTELKLA